MHVSISCPANGSYFEVLPLVAFVSLVLPAKVTMSSIFPLPCTSRAGNSSWYNGRLATVRKIVDLFVPLQKCTAVLRQLDEFFSDLAISYVIELT